MASGRRLVGGTAGVAEPAWLLEFPFRGGRLCLDFAATLGSRGQRNIERLNDPADLERWIAAAGLGEVAEVRRTDLTAAKRLREAIFGLVCPGGGAVDRGLVRTVNRAAAVVPLVPVLAASARARGWSVGSAPSQALSTVARDAIDLLGGPLLARVKRCAGEDCTILFVDESRPFSRRWCSMEVCGNLAKSAGLRDQRAARARRRAPSPGI
jgi:predicted RNA-binding Zn ribbon-like protein